MHKWIVLLMAALPWTASAQWALDAEATRLYDDNVSRAQQEADILRDHAWAARAGVGRLFALGAWDASLRAEVRGARYDRYSGLDENAIGLRATGRRKLGIGLTAPWIAADAAVFRERYQEAVRDGRRVAAALEVGKRIDERLEAALSAGYDRRAQREDLPTTPLSGRPFSVQGRTLALRGSYAIADSVLVFARAGWRRGDVVSSTRRNPEIFRESAAIANDPAFGGDFIAYRLTGARTRSGSLGLAWSVGRHATLAGEVGRDRTEARGGLAYEGNIYRLSLVYRD